MLTDVRVLRRMYVPLPVCWRNAWESLSLIWELRLWFVNGMTALLRWDAVVGGLGLPSGGVLYEWKVVAMRLRE